MARLSQDSRKLGSRARLPSDPTAPSHHGRSFLPSKATVLAPSTRLYASPNHPFNPPPPPPRPKAAVPGFPDPFTARLQYDIPIYISFSSAPISARNDSVALQWRFSLSPPRYMHVCIELHHLKSMDTIDTIPRIGKGKAGDGNRPIFPRKPPRACGTTESALKRLCLPARNRRMTAGPTSCSVRDQSTVARHVPWWKRAREASAASHTREMQ